MQLLPRSRSRDIRSFVRPIVLVAAAAQVACGGDDPTGVVPGGFVGPYTATTFTLTAGGTTTDVLQQGGSLQLVLGDDRSVTGRLFVPDGEEDGSDLDASMAGTWSLAGDAIRFEQTADTFVRDMPFRFDGTRLLGDATFGDDARIRVTLQRAE